jgi:hypothetical protein
MSNLRGRPSNLFPERTLLAFGTVIQYKERRSVVRPKVQDLDSSGSLEPRNVGRASRMETPDNYNVGADVPIAKRRQGMAIASLVIGIVGFFTCGLAGLGPFTGTILGFIAVSRASKNPQQYGGKELAIAGIVTSVISLFIGPIIAAIVIPNTIRAQQAAHEARAISYVRMIGQAQNLYAAGVGRGHFADLHQLVTDGFLDGSLASGETGGFRFTSTPVNVPGMPPMFDTTARPLTTGALGKGNRSFGSNETFAVYEASGDVELRGTPANRKPANGVPLE